MTRLTNGFSKKTENLAAAVARHFMYDNFASRAGATGGLLLGSAPDRIGKRSAA